MPHSEIELHDLRIELKRLWREHKKRSSDALPHAIQLLRLKREKAQDEQQFVVLTSLLESECSRYGLHAERRQLIREMTSIFPDDPMSWIGLASHLLNESGDLREAKSVIETAIAKALAEKRFVRHALNTKARIARRLGDYDLLAETLNNLLSESATKSSPDIDWEDDFLMDLPTGALPLELIETYRQFVERSARR